MQNLIKNLRPMTSLDPTTSAVSRDQALIAAWRDGDPDAGEELLAHYHRFFLSLCARYRVSAEGDQLDLYQEIVVRLLAVLPKLKIRQSFAGYLRRVFHTAWRESLGRGQNRELVMDPEAKRELGEPDRREILVAIEECTGTLTVREHAVFEGRVDNDHSFAELARLLDMSHNHLHVVYHQARQKMRDCLEKKGFAL